MDELKAKELVVQAGLELVKNGLIARTWGNVSCRLDDKYFVITPSGREYESLTSSEIVKCKIEDGSYEGDIKPSSEKGVHALVYRKRPEATFVIHTHQLQASAASVLNKTEIPASLSSEGEPIPLAEYGLPSTKKLVNGVEKALERTKGRAVIMSHHGTVCFGADDRKTFDRALALEIDSKNYIEKIYEEASGKKPKNERDIYSQYLGGKAKFPDKPLMLGSSRRTENGFILSLNGQESEYKLELKVMPLEAALHAEIYRKRKDINYIAYADSAPLLAVSAAKTSLVAILDDFAQIEGRRANCSKSAAPFDVVRALAKRAGVLVSGNGALCCGATESDAHAVLLVMEKNAYAQIAASLMGKPRSLSFIDCLIMRTVYKLSYSKKK
ncbi:MAG: hypothetical protein CVU91_10715 [Firmicutes bacterium HGW-Firmicutes-16]|nr:MAG: hypothetical protein CVU91_10715 [Firmicutes bacterium HGW-Firmicutes-16]